MDDKDITNNEISADQITTGSITQKNFEVFIYEFPMIFRRGDRYFMELYDIDYNNYRFIEVSANTAHREAGSRKH